MFVFLCCHQAASAMLREARMEAGVTTAQARVSAKQMLRVLTVTVVREATMA